MEVGARIELVGELGTSDISVGRYQPFKCFLRELEPKNWLALFPGSYVGPREQIKL